MKKAKLIIYTVFLRMALFALPSCTFFYGERADLTYPAMFDALWKDYNETYALFDVRGVDWNAQYESCRNLVKEDMTDREFFEVLQTLLYPLEDSHVYVKTPLGSLNAGEDNTAPDNFSLTELCSQYIANPKNAAITS